MTSILDLSPREFAPPEAPSNEHFQWEELAHLWNSNDLAAAHDWINERWSRLIRNSVAGQLDPEAQFLQALAFAVLALHFTQHGNQEGAVLMIDDALVALNRFRPGFLGVRRVALEAPPAGVVLADPRVPWVAGLSDSGVAVLHLDVRRRVATLAIAHARPQASALPAAGRTGPWWLPAGDAVHVVDTARWRVESTVPAPAGLVTVRRTGK